jgi:imidazolonepropionase-like amidohydrolase
VGYLKQSFDKGIKLRIGTVWPVYGKATISEPLLLAEYGFTIPANLQSSTINGTAALGLENKYGLVEKGKNANFLIWDKRPFDYYKNFQAGRTMIKDGIVFEN